MGLRDSINQRPRLVPAVTVAVIVLALVAIVVQQFNLPGRAPGHRPPHDSPAGADRPLGADDDAAPRPGERRPASRGPQWTAARLSAALAGPSHPSHPPHVIPQSTTQRAQVRTPETLA